METLTLLDCGHPESAHSDSTHGYGLDRDGKKHCYACCHALDLKTMKETGRIDAYLSRNGQQLTNWPGHPLAMVTREWTTSAGGFAQHTTITHIRARDAAGALWYGRGPGRGMYIRLRRSTRK